ncbi:DUF3857 domain-containing protein [Pseudotenacibaculum haliotis]|uniref:DUF3857 domain-containing protein n=1 Tax=Pseudotenacibaculum haliotis TaxID=1862138 RepID=A0ABW5LU98_9FLAO
MGQVTLQELKMTNYEKDPDASAVILHEQSYVYFNSTKKNSFIRYYYVRVKILKKDAYDLATIQIPFYKTVNVKDIKGTTYNLNENGEIEKTDLHRRSIIKSKFNKDVRIKSFALPNVKEGSVIEYKFTIRTRSYGVYDWEIQSDIPKIKAIYGAGVPIFLSYKLKGLLEPKFQTSKLKKCFSDDTCRELWYEFSDVPSFIEEEYLTSKNNYISKLDFQPENFDWITVRKGGKTLRIIDRYYRGLEKGLEKYRTHFRGQFSDSILHLKDSLEKAKMVFNHIRDYYKLGRLNKKVDDLYKEKIASAFTINTALYASLKAVNLKNVNLVTLSTREKGFVNENDFNISDFNYYLVRIVIDHKEYFLDATNKYSVFGIIPFQCLNGRALIIDTENGSHWKEVKPYKNNTTKVTMSLILDEEDNFFGKKSIISSGYPALFKRNNISEIGEKNYVKHLETENEEIEIQNYHVQNLDSIEKPLKEVYELTMDGFDINLSKILNTIKKNPFQLKQRVYPIDYGYNKTVIYRINIKTPKGYVLKGIPESKSFFLPNDAGFYTYKKTYEDGVFNIFIKFKIDKIVFLGDDYKDLKKFYDQMIKIQNTPIILQKGS